MQLPTTPQWWSQCSWVMMGPMWGMHKVSPATNKTAVPHTTSVYKSTKHRTQCGVVGKENMAATQGITVPAQAGNSPYRSNEAGVLLPRRWRGGTQVT